MDLHMHYHFKRRCPGQKRGEPENTRNVTFEKINKSATDTNWAQLNHKKPRNSNYAGEMTAQSLVMQKAQTCAVQTR